ncbi:MAG: hypothetical protein AB7L28_09220 [Kofleriaceae bacterium]
MGSRPEDNSDAEEGVPGTPSISRKQTADIDRSAALASRIDAMMREEDDELGDAEPPVEEIEEIEEISEADEIATPAARPSAPPVRPPPPPRGVVVVPPVPAATTQRIPPPRLATVIGRPAPPPPPPPARGTSVAIPALPARAKPAPASERVAPDHSTDDLEITSGDEPASDDAAANAAIGTSPTLTPPPPLEAQLESPTVVDRAIAQLGELGAEQQAAALDKEIDATNDPAAAAVIAYELGEHYDRRLIDEARAVKAYGRALSLDPGLRANLWALRRIFYRRGLWPNLTKLIDAELAYARDDTERADLLLEKARVVSQHMGDAEEARAALDEAVRIAPQHQGALLELERVVARSGDDAAMIEVWERLAEAAQHPARKLGYWLELGRLAARSEYARAQEAIAQAAELAAAAGGTSAERVARERLRIAEQHGIADDVIAGLEALVSALLATFGPAGPGSEPGATAAGAPDEPLDRGTAIRREVVALRRRHAQLIRTSAPERAWEILQQALAVSPGESLVLADLTELAEELGRYDDLAELVQNWQAVEGDASRATMLSLRRADALLRGGQRDQARELLDALEASAPGFIVVTSAAERHALGSGDVTLLAKAYLSAANAAVLGSWLGPGHAPTPDREAAAALYVQAAELYAYEIGGPEAFDDARQALGKALEAVPELPAAVEALIELDDLTGSVTEGIARLKALAAATTGEPRRSFYERAIRMARSHGDLESVLELERALLELEPKDLALRWRIESTLAQLGRDDDRASLLIELAELEPDKTRQGTALFAAARLQERAGAVESATDLYRRVLAVWPGDTFARESLIDLLRAQERWADLVAERRAEASALPDGPAARRALREAAWVLTGRMADPAAAIAVFDEWLSRFPDDRAALDGLARAAHQAGEFAKEATARRPLVALDPSPDQQWLLGRALEAAGELDNAADVYRALATSDPPSVAATSGALGLADLGARRSDTAMRLEAVSALASRTTDPQLAAALAEDSGWMYVLVLEDFDRAAQSFAAAIERVPQRRGALLGAALAAARRMEPESLSASYDGLAESVQMPEAAAALHMRASAVAVSTGDLEISSRRLAAALASAPDDTSALIVVAETTQLPTVDANPADVRAVVDSLLARAELLELRAALSDDPVARASWELDRAEALEVAGRTRDAAAVVTAVLKKMPTDVRALEALRRLARRVGDDAALAKASYQLARAIGDRAGRLELLRQAAALFDSDAVGDGELALAAYKRILQIEPSAPELERALALLRERADVRGLITALTERLTWLETERPADEDAIPLLLERATVLHGIGDSNKAIIDLDAVLARAASNIDALRFRADLAFNAGDVDRAVTLWQRCVAVETRPDRRDELKLHLAQVLAENVNDIAGAIENVERVVESTPNDVHLRERLIALCLRANDHQRAASEIRAAIGLRMTAEEKAREELRLARLLRDKLGDRMGARGALERARSLDPLNLEAIHDLAEAVDGSRRSHVLRTASNDFRTAATHTPLHAELYDGLSQIRRWDNDFDGHWLALAALEAVGSPTADQRQVLAQGRRAQVSPGATRGSFDDAARIVLRGGKREPLDELWFAIAPAVRLAMGVDPGTLGFARGDRVAVKKLGDKYRSLATALAWFGIADADIYVSANRQGVARALAGETPVLCVGADVAAATTPIHRFQVGRIVATLADGYSTLHDLRERELAWTFIAALRACEVPVPPALAAQTDGDDASIAERAKVIRKEIARKDRATVAQLAQTRGAELSDVAGLRRRALTAGQRTGLLWAGDLAVAHAQLDVGRTGRALVDCPAELDLTTWSVSEDHSKLRELLGVAIKGTL